ncbi:hypothetical protein RR46_12010 [Papilio xuthus]|uniref:Uncharacterized protein n=1 Tax=Papilio xuthus TaxID=66420 RepID=A0A194PNJ7_PAPXU|nr:hypothetical protein RR46_12010 [Papilio xuthus]
MGGRRWAVGAQWQRLLSTSGRRVSAPRSSNPSFNDKVMIGAVQPAGGAGRGGAPPTTLPLHSVTFGLH